MASAKPVVLITGSAGRIGSAIRAALRDRFTVVGFELDCRDAPDCIDADLATEAALAAACRRLRERCGGRLASVIHLAAFYDFSGQPDDRYEAVNVQGTRHLLHALQDFEVEQFVYASTMLVHAPTRPGVPLDETAGLAPKWPYPRSKLAAEEVVSRERGRIPAVILRLAGVYSEDCEVPSLAYQIQRIYERQMLSHVFPGDPAHGQAFLLGWRPQHSLRGTLPRMIGQLKQGPAAWYRRNGIPLPLWLQDLAEQPAPETQLIAEFEALDRHRHGQTVWCHFANAALGLWLVSSPFIFGLAGHWGMPGELPAPGQRGLPLSDTWMTASDLVSGLLITLFALLSLSRRTGWARWATAALGGWLLFAPLVFWTPSAVVYANDTLVGALVILFAVGVPATPGISPVARLAGPDTPPGWDYSPSSWNQRIPIIALALVGLFVSRYLAAFQLGHLDAAWDPFFGDGTERIVTSAVSEAWPVSDAGLGAATYVLEIITGVIGDKRRWRTMPWLVLLFGAMIVPLGGVSIFFIVIQPIVIGTWCTLCLAAAVAMLLQIPYSFDEILATLQFLRERRRQGKSLWYVMLHGDTIDGGSADYSDDFEAPPGAVLREMLRGGVGAPWTVAVSAAIGSALMLTRLLFDTSGPAADNDHLVGALVVSFAAMALAEVARPLRFANAALGAWLLPAPWLIDGYGVAGGAFACLAGLLLIGLALPRGAIVSH